jgi:hypothetical protein
MDVNEEACAASKFCFFSEAFYLLTTQALVRVKEELRY